MTAQIVVESSTYRGGGVHVSVAVEPDAVLGWASCYVADDIEVSVSDVRCTRAEIVHLQALLDRALIEYDARNGRA